VKENNMTVIETTDLEQAQQFFERTRSRVLEVTEGLSAAQWQFKPAPDRWSIAENLEHMVIVQDRVLGPILGQLAQAPAASPDRDWRAVDAIILQRFSDRSLKAKAPEFVEPGGELSRDATLERFSRNYERMNAFIESTPGLREHVLESPPLRFVTNGEHTVADGYQWALTLAAHDERHVRQILEIKADTNYPV
jgi:hypothetical protein